MSHNNTLGMTIRPHAPDEASPSLKHCAETQYLAGVANVFTGEANKYPRIKKPRSVAAISLFSVIPPNIKRPTL